MSELFSIQLQNRQQQGGDGVWLDLPTTTEQVQVALRQIGISSDNPQGLFISGYFAEEEKRFAIPYNMILASSVDELNFWLHDWKHSLPGNVQSSTPPCKPRRVNFPASGESPTFPKTWTTMCICRMCTGLPS